MTYDNASRVWLVSRRDAETGLFVGDIVVMTANTAYFIRTDNFQGLKHPAAAAGDGCCGSASAASRHHGGEGLELGADREQRHPDAQDHRSGWTTTSGRWATRAG